MRKSYLRTQPADARVHACLRSCYCSPIASTGAKLPVMVFLYGGAFKEGDNVGPFGIYSGAYIASTQNVIVVAVNYRLGAMGFLVTDTLKGNFALMDQRAGMQWVQRNIGLVGGDPTQVTLWGESAGKLSLGSSRGTSLIYRIMSPFLQAR
jgi:carboxylesterase type B